MKKLKDILRELVEDGVSLVEIDTTDNETGLIMPDDEEIDELIDEYIEIIKSALID